MMQVKALTWTGLSKERGWNTSGQEESDLEGTPSAGLMVRESGSITGPTLAGVGQNSQTTGRASRAVAGAAKTAWPFSTTSTGTASSGTTSSAATESQRSASDAPRASSSTA